MALVTCTECGAQVSDKALACVKCGAPVNTVAVTLGPASKITTTQQTSKPYKAGQLAGGVLLAVGVVLAVGGAQLSGGLTMLLGLIVYLGARMGAWWNNG